MIIYANNRFYQPRSSQSSMPNQDPQIRTPQKTPKSVVVLKTPPPNSKPPPTLPLPTPNPIHQNTLPTNREIPFRHHSPILHQLRILLRPLLIMHPRLRPPLLPLFRTIKAKRHERDQKDGGDSTSDTDFRARGEGCPLLGDFLRGGFGV